MILNGLVLADDSEDVVLAHDQMLHTVDLDLGARIFPEQDPVARLHLARHAGPVVGDLARTRRDHETFLRFLKSLYRAHPRTELHVILDNLSVHKHQEVLAWAAKRRRLTLHFTPTYASWLNLVERWFAGATAASG